MDTKTKYSCIECEKNKTLRDFWGCENPATLPIPTMVEIENGKQYEYFNCPKKFIPYECIDFVNQITAIKDLGLTMPQYDEIAPRFLMAYNYYTAKANEYSAIVNEEIKNDRS